RPNMSAIELLADLSRRGVRLWVEGPNLRFSSPPGTMAHDTIEQIGRHKAELMALLLGPARSPRVLPGSAEGAVSEPNGHLSLNALRHPPGTITSWAEEHASPYVRHVAPLRAFLYDRLGLARTFRGGDDCDLIDEKGRRYTDFIAQYGAVPFGHDPQPVW